MLAYVILSTQNYLPRQENSWTSFKMKFKATFSVKTSLSSPTQPYFQHCNMYLVTLYYFNNAIYFLPLFPFSSFWVTWGHWTHTLHVECICMNKFMKDSMNEWYDIIKPSIIEQLWINQHKIIRINGIVKS